MIGAEQRHLVLVGPTAAGKSAVAHRLAVQLRRIEIISVDSMQVYRGMDIGTAKVSPAEREEVTYHLLDVADPSETYTVGRYQADFRRVLGEIESRGNRALLVGGTGLYLRAAIDGLVLPGEFPDVRAALDEQGDTADLFARLRTLDPVAAARMEPTNRRRVLRALEVCIGSGRPFSSFGPGLATYPSVPYELVGIDVPRHVLDDRIARRYQEQLAAGFLDEVVRLQSVGEGLGRTARQALGYRELADHLAGACSLTDALELAVSRTRRFARRQQRWFRRDPRIRWQAADDNSMVVATNLLRDWTLCS